MAKKDDQLKRPSRVLMYAYLACLVLAVIFVRKIYKIQHEWKPNPTVIKEMLPKKFKKQINPRRGSIIDHNGNALAIPTPAYDIYIDSYVQKQNFDNDKTHGKRNDSIWIAKAEAMSKGLDSILNIKGKRPKDYSDAIKEGRKKKNRYVNLAKGIDKDTLEMLMTLPLFNEPRHKGGIIIEEKEVLKYPYNGLARRTIGYIDENNPNGYIGIAGRYNRELNGKAGYKWAKRTDNYALIDDIDSIGVDVVDGLDIRTTLDINIQEIAERSLRQWVDTARHINSACAVVMDVETGSVRAMVNLQRNSRGKMREIFNIAAGRPSEPGSIFKTVILTTLLEDGLVTLDDKMKIDIDLMRYPGFEREERDKAAFSYGTRHNTDYIPVIDGLMVSSNYVFRRQVVDKYYHDPEELINRLHSYNLGADFNFELTEPGSARSSIPDPHGDTWSGSTLPSTAIGYSVMVTPLQILSFYNAIANDGKMMMPHIIESFEKDGEVVEKIEPTLLNIVCSKATTDTLKRALKKVCHSREGTAYKSLRGIKCEAAGKTGTAWIALTGKEKIGAKNEYTLADDTKRYQGTFAGFFPADDPKYSVIIVVYTDPMKTGREGGGNKPAKVFKNIVNELWAYDESWREQISERGSMPKIKKSEFVIPDGEEVPNLIGAGLRDALYTLENMGYKCEYTGVGHVVKQEFNGETIKLTLK